MFRTHALIFALISLAGCANWQEHQQRQSNKYIGKNVELMYAEYGVPVG